MAVGAYTVGAPDRKRGLGADSGAGRIGGRHRGGRSPGRRRGEPAARPVPRGRDARVRGRPAGAGGQVPRDVRRRERADHQPADPARLTRIQLPARALGSVDRVRRRADRDVRALQRDAQRLRALDGGRARRRDRRLAVRPARRSHADGRVHHQRRVRRARRRAAVRRAPARAAGRVPAAAVAVTADRRRARRPRLAWPGRSGGRRCSCCCRTGPTTSPTRSRSRPRSRRT